MHRARNIFRLIFLLLAIYLLVYINQKTADHSLSVAEFKVKMYQKINTDSLNTKDKVDLLVNETSKFVDESSRVRKGTQYLSALFGLLVVAELVFLIVIKRTYK
jgi:hypothetical protein